MNTQEILTIIAMAALGLCLVLAFSKGMTKNLKTKSAMTHACSFLVVIAVALLAVTQFLSEKENMDWEIGSVATASMPNGGRAKKGGGKASMGVEHITCNANCPCDKNAPPYICSPYHQMTGDSNGKKNRQCTKCTGIKDTTTCPKGDYCEEWSN
tara:strand:+ start:1731 stop:2195 length:465 start_codon:yes stop_codon:yes gene_type:complete